MRVDSSRERRPTAGFGWVDHRVITGGHLAALSGGAAAVYLVLCVVADRRGISYYSPARLGQLVKHSASRVEAALEELRQRGLVARDGRFVQVLSLDTVNRPAPLESAEPRLQPPDTSDATPAARRAACQEEEPEAILACLTAGERDEWLARARQKLLSVSGNREPSPAIVSAVAAGLARAGARR